MILWVTIVSFVITGFTCGSFIFYFLRLTWGFLSCVGCVFQATALAFIKDTSFLLGAVKQPNIQSPVSLVQSNYIDLTYTVIISQAAVHRCNATADFLQKDKPFFQVTINDNDLLIHFVDRRVPMCSFLTSKKHWSILIPQDCLESM